MALSDACYEFNHNVITAAERLGAMAEEYAAPPFSYEREEIATLRSACAEVAAAAEPGNCDLNRLQRAVMRLVRLAEYTRNRHDAGPNLPHDPPAEA
jgi:hypothetical protein